MLRDETKNQDRDELGVKSFIGQKFRYGDIV